MSEYDNLTIQELTDLLIHKVLVLAHHEYSNTPESLRLLPSLRSEIREIQNEIIGRGSH
jgi:hypothetical protein